jgi:hypothetical protein
LHSLKLQRGLRGAMVVVVEREWREGRMDVVWFIARGLRSDGDERRDKDALDCGLRQESRVV